MRLREFINRIQENDSQYPAMLRGAEQVAGFLSDMGQEVDPEQIENMFGYDCEFVLKRVPIGAIRPSSEVAHHAPIRGKLTQYKAMQAETQPPILVDDDGEIVDGHHRYRAALRRRDKDILIYMEVPLTEQAPELAAPESNLQFDYSQFRPQLDDTHSCPHCLRHYTGEMLKRHLARGCPDQWNRPTRLREDLNWLPYKFMWHPEGGLVAGDGLHHTQILWSKPEQFGLDQNDVTQSKGSVGLHASPSDFDLLKKVFQQGWCRVTKVGDNLNIEGPTLVALLGCARFCSDRMLEISKLFLSAVLERKHTTLSGPSLARFLRSGRILQSAFESVEQDRETAFNDLADAQRGAPEAAMLRATHVFSGGVMSGVLEHVGDLTHRMAEHGGAFGFNHVLSKVELGLRRLLHGYGFEREHQENMVHNNKSRLEHPDYGPQITPELENQVLRDYAQAHAELPVYNRMQECGRDAAIYIGMKQYYRAIKVLEEIQTAIKSGTYKHIALSYDPNYPGKNFNAGGLTESGGSG